MKNSIKWRLVAIYVVLVIIVMVISGTLVVWSTAKDEYDTMKNELIDAAEVISRTINPKANLGMIESEIKAIINNYSEKIVYLIDPSGELVYPKLSLNKSEYLYHPQVQGALYGKNVEALDVIRRTGETFKYRGYATAIYDGDQVAYIVYVMSSTEPVVTTIGKIIQILIYAVILSIFIASLLGIVFSNFITKPITLLSNQARLMASGNLKSSIEVQSTDEIGELTRNFNIMAKSLNETLAEISSEKTKLEIVFSQMTDGLLVFNTKGKLVSLNPASERMLHVKEQDDFDDIFSFYIEEHFKDIYATVLEEITQYIIKKSDRYYNVCFAKFIGQTKENSGLISVVQDITEHKKLEMMQKEFVANVSHELRTPLTTIKSYTETLLEGAIAEEDVAEKFLAVINGESDRMTALVQDLLELSKLDNEQTKFKMGKIDLNQLVKDSVDNYRMYASNKYQKMTFYPPKNEYTIFGDIFRIEQVFKNIITNAIKYSPENATIDVRITDDIKNITVAIEDTGLGISPADLERIFDRFYRVDKARSREMGGTGLGLAIAKEIMEYHGGNIAVESELGFGATFYLVFPKTFKPKNRDK